MYHILERLYTSSHSLRRVEKAFLRRESGSSWPSTLAVATVSFDVEEIADVKALPDFCRRLADLDVRASFAVIGVYVRRYPDEHRAILAENHEIINHSFSHPSHPDLCPKRQFQTLSADEVRAEIEKCHTAVAEQLGYEMTGFRNPHFLHQFNSHTYDALSALGYRVSTSKSMMDVQATPVKVANGLIECPLSPCPDHIYTVFDSYHMSRGKTLLNRHTPREYFERGRVLAEMAIRHRSYINTYFDPIHVMHCEPFWEFAELLAKSTSIRLMTYSDLAKMVLEA